ncbi:pilus assembly PilX family protein [Paenibacillus wynnii]|uniref:Type 4 fimbrial biogenesis protein PilX N-terminal domain-containing protein n=1 Tax=Paenibacillus wynnii TaxID=268407 RepID=A0A098MFW1_9BACL|nr:hypothetical protein [Paenibacillus wynnii]KGE20432.1 hypothetical protein PWYN_14585 [Paenibacillus wynnii]
MLRRINNRRPDSKTGRQHKYFHSEEGSALVLVMFIVLLLTILGVAVLSAAIGGAERTETRENDVQSLHLAEKGLNEATAYIQSQLEGLTDLDPNKLDEVLTKLNQQGLGVTTEMGTNSSGTIEEIKYSGKQPENPNKLTREYYINVTASAMVNGVKRTLKQQIVIDSYPEYLKYAFGSNKTLTLNGAPHLMGNIYAGEKLIVSNTAKYTYKGNPNLSKLTQFPKVMVNESATGSALDIGSGEVHVQSLDSIVYSKDGQKEENVATSSDVEQTLKDILGIEMEKVKIKEQKKFVQINVEESFFEKMVQGFSTSSVTTSFIRSEYSNNHLGDWLKTLTAKTLIRTLSQSTPPVKPEQQTNEASDDYLQRLDQYKIDLLSYHNTFINLTDSVMVEGNLLIDGLDYRGIMYNELAKKGTDVLAPKWLIINGDLVIDNNKTDFLPVSGNILVLGNVKIKGNVAFDSTMFVLRETTVEDAVIKGLGESGNTKELVLISKGHVLINRIDAFTNADPSEMEAFFYTDSSGDLYGVGSIFWLNGGFFAKGDLTLNAALGNVTEPDAAGFPLNFSDQQQQGVRERFKITYNHQIYSHQQSSLPRVKKVNISVGPLELVSSTP